MSKGKKKEEGKKKNEYRKKVRRRLGTSPAAGVYLPEGRFPSTFDIPCSIFDIHLLSFFFSLLCTTCLKFNIDPVHFHIGFYHW
jgi:hypothetical protein